MIYVPKYRISSTRHSFTAIRAYAGAFNIISAGEPIADAAGFLNVII